MTEQFLSLFHRYDYIYKPHGNGDFKWFSLKDHQKNWKLQDSEILKAISGVHPRYLFGCRSGKTSRFVILDIDKNSKYHSKAQLKKLLKLLTKAGIKNTSLYRSSDSGGWHLYIFFEQPMLAIELRKYFSEFLILCGYKLKSGQLEVFPQPSKKGSVGNGIRLPLQSGFAWIDKSTLEVTFERDSMSPMQALDHFTGDLNDSNSFVSFQNFRNYVGQLRTRKTKIEEPDVKVKSFRPSSTNNSKSNDSSIDHVKEVKEVFGVLPPGIISDNWIRGRQYYSEGLTGPSQRADAIFCLSHYLFYGDPSIELQSLAYGYEQEREWAIKEILEAKNNGFSSDINNERPDSIAQSERCAHWVPPDRRDQVQKTYKPQMPISYIKANIKRRADARKRIQEALNELVDRGTYFSTNELCTLARCSSDTLYKHKDIWKESYDAAKERGLATCSGQINVGKGGDSSKINSPVPSNTKKEPFGLLACRQILSELNMRSDKKERKKKKQHLTLIAKQETLWLQKCKNTIPKSIPKCPTKKLKASITVLSSLLSMAPDYDSEQWLTDQIRKLNQELSHRIKGPKQLRLLSPTST